LDAINSQGAVMSEAEKVMQEREAGYRVGWWMFWVGFCVGVVLTLAIAGLALLPRLIFGSHHLFCGG
jgi:hypothetical protein